MAVDRGSRDRGKSALPVRIASRDDAARLYLGSGDIIKVSPAHVFCKVVVGRVSNIKKTRLPGERDAGAESCGLGFPSAPGRRENSGEKR